MATFHAVTDIVEPLSLDEAFLDIAGAQRRLGRPARIAQWVRDTVADEQGITCSVGVASTKFVAKLASSLAKPDGMIVVPQAEVLGFLHQLPVGALWGVGSGPRRRSPGSACVPSPTSRIPRSRRCGERSATSRAATCTRWPGVATSGPSSARPGRRASGPTRRSPTTSTTRSSSTASCCGSATGRPLAFAPPG